MAEETAATNQPKLDDLGRIIVDGESSNQETPETKGRHLVDAQTELSSEEERQKKEKNGELDKSELKNETLYTEADVRIAQLICRCLNPELKLTPEFIRKIGDAIFKSSSSKIVEILMDSIATIPVNPDTLAAIIGYYTSEYADAIKKTLITEKIPEAIAKAFNEDKYTTVKRYLVFLVCLTSYRLVTVDSFLNVINNLVAKLDDASDFRRDSIARVILFICRTAPEEIDDSQLEDIVEKVRPFVDYTFVSRYYQSENSRSITELLLQSTRFDFHTSKYAEIFKDKSFPVDLPAINFEFGAQDLAPTPTTIVKTCTSDKDYFPVLVDICLDYITFFSKDLGSLTDMLLALPLADDKESLRGNATYDPTIHACFAEAIFTAILSDCLRIPRSAYPMALHVSLLAQLLTSRQDITPELQHCVETVLNDNTLDVCCSRRLVNLLAHLFCNFNDATRVSPIIWENWEAAANLQTQEDSRKLFIQSFIEHVFLYSTPEFIVRSVPPQFHHLIPAAPKLSESDLADIKTLQEKFKEASFDDIQKYITETNSKIGEAGTLSLFLKTLFFNITSGEAAGGQIKQQWMNVSEYFKVEEHEWMGQQLVDTAYSIFSSQPTTLAQVIVLFICDDVINFSVNVKISAYFNWMFEDTDESKARLLLPSTWDVFHNVMNSIFSWYRNTHNSEASLEAMKQLFEMVIELHKEINGVMMERLLFGNLKEFVLNNLTSFSAALDEIRGLLSDKTKQEFKDFIDRMALLCY